MIRVKSVSFLPKSEIGDGVCSILRFKNVQKEVLFAIGIPGIILIFDPYKKDIRKKVKLNTRYWYMHNNYYPSKLFDLKTIGCLCGEIQGKIFTIDYNDDFSLNSCIQKDYIDPESTDSHRSWRFRTFLSFLCRSGNGSEIAYSSDFAQNLPKKISFLDVSKTNEKWIDRTSYENSIHDSRENQSEEVLVARALVVAIDDGWLITSLFSDPEYESEIILAKVIKESDNKNILTDIGSCRIYTIHSSASRREVISVHDVPNEIYDKKDCPFTLSFDYCRKGFAFYSSTRGICVFSYNKHCVLDDRIVDKSIDAEIAEIQDEFRVSEKNIGKMMVLYYFQFPKIAKSLRRRYIFLNKGKFRTNENCGKKNEISLFVDDDDHKNNRNKCGFSSKWVKVRKNEFDDFPIRSEVLSVCGGGSTIFLFSLTNHIIEMVNVDTYYIRNQLKFGGDIDEKERVEFIVSDHYDEYLEDIQVLEVNMPFGYSVKVLKVMLF